MSELTIKLKLLAAYESGQLDSLKCPKCHNDSINVYFTVPALNSYRTWFVCTRCLFHVRIQNSGRPIHFSIKRINEQLEAYDDELNVKKKGEQPKGSG